MRSRPPKNAATAPSSVWSRRWPAPRPPRAVTSAAASSTVVRPVTYTVAPHSPSTTATPRPTPRVDPVTTATVPLRSGGRQLDDGNDHPDHDEPDQHDLHPQPPRRKVPHDEPPG